MSEANHEGIFVSVIYKCQEENVGSKSMYARYNMQNDGRETNINKIHSSPNPLLYATEKNKHAIDFDVDRDKMYLRIYCVLDDLGGWPKVIR